MSESRTAYRPLPASRAYLLPRFIQIPSFHDGKSWMGRAINMNQAHTAAVNLLGNEALAVHRRLGFDGYFPSFLAIPGLYPVNRHHAQDVPIHAAPPNVVLGAAH